MISSLLERAVLTHGEQTAIEHGGRSSSYRELAERVARRARQIVDHGGEVGDRVGLLAPNGPRFLELSYAVARAGRVLVPLNTRLPARTQAHLLEHAGAGLLYVSSALPAEAAALAAEAGPAARVVEFDERQWWRDVEAPALEGARSTRPEDAAHIYYTSGTTGDPKGVILTHRNVCSHALMAIAALGLDDRDVFAHLAPMFHLADAWASYAITAVGGQHRFAARFEVPRVLEILRQGTTVTNLVPTMLSDLVHHPQATGDYPRLRRLLSGGAPISPALVSALIRTFGCPYVQTYGLTETSPFLTMSTLPARFDALDAEAQFAERCKTGRPLVGVDVRVVREDGAEVCRDGVEVGEIVARGDSVTPGYWHNPEATAAAFREGWFHTGDLATQDANGFLNIVDRKKDVVLSGGETVYSTEVEHVLAAHPAVREVAVLGVPHPRWGEAVVAVVVSREPDSITEDALRRHARQDLGSAQVPKRVLFRDALPRTGTGKLAKRLLRDELADLFDEPGPTQ